MTIEASACHLGRYAWVETRLFEIVGSWASTVPEPDVKVALAAQSHHHAWRAGLWRDRLPDVGDLAPRRVVGPSSPELVAALEELARPQGAGETIEKLAGLVRVVLPRLVVAYSAHLERASGVSDATVIRSLRFALADAVDDWRLGEGLLQGCLAGVDDVRRAAARQESVESLVVAAEPIWSR